MKKILVIVMLIFAFGCSDDATEPSENTIVGKWKTRPTISKLDDVEPNQVLLILEFTNSGTFNIFREPPKEEMFIEQGSYSISNNELTIVSSKCENTEGRYKFKFKDNGVEFTRIEDDCGYNIIMNGFFLDYDIPFIE